MCSRPSTRFVSYSEKSPTCPTRESNPDLQANTLKRRCKSLLILAVEVCYIPSRVTFSPTKYDFKLSLKFHAGHRESFLMRLQEFLLGSRVGCPLVGAIVIERKKSYLFQSRKAWVARSTGKHSTTYVTVNAGFYCK